MKKISLLVVVLSLFSLRVQALELIFYPAERLFLNEAQAERGTYDLIAHLLIVKNNSNETVTIEKLNLQAEKDGKVFQELHFDVQDLIKPTSELNQMKQQGMEVIANVILPEKILGPNGKLGSSAELKPGEILFAQNIYLTVQKIPSLLRAVASAKNSAQASAEIKVVQYKSPNQYIFPLEGAWYMQAVPNVTSHHRWMFQTEFGIDFFKVDDKGSLSKTDGKTVEDYYGFGQPVLAAADGVVVLAVNDAVQNWDAWFPRDGESEEQFAQRSQKYQVEFMKKDMLRAVTGNVIAIQHSGGEYSAYAHLKTGSVQVKVGDRVKQGQQIAEVGNTGDYYLPHLHFQISDSTDLLLSRSLPFEFINLNKRPELGHFARIKK